MNSVAASNRLASAQPAPLAAVPAAIESLGGSLSYLQDRLSVLRTRLEPVLAPPDVAGQTASKSIGDSRYLVAVADQVSDHDAIVRSLSATVDDLIQRAAL
jgi:hypothetical protein